MDSLLLNYRIGASVGLALALTWLGCSREQSVQGADRATCERIEHCETVLKRPAYVSPDYDRRVELRAIYGEVMKAYHDRDIAVLREWERRIPALVEKDGGDLFDEIEGPVYRTLFEIFRPGVPGCALGEYADADSFARDTAAALSLARLWGDSCRRRKRFSPFFSDLEANVYRQLAAYHGRFKAQGREDLGRLSDMFLQEWEDRIDSDEGYTKSVLDYRVARSTLSAWQVIERHSDSWDSVVSNEVLRTVHPLLRVGYRPKWLKSYEHVPEPDWETVKARSQALK